MRLTTQLGDGAFEVALASLFFFSPERATTAGGIALAFAVLTLPFTLVGPWAGVPLDRWSRRNTLVLGNLVRARPGAGRRRARGHRAGRASPLYAVVLVCVSVNRFLLAALSAGLPHVVAPRSLVTANAVTPTLGTAAALVGSAAVYGARLLGVVPRHPPAPGRRGAGRGRRAGAAPGRPRARVPTGCVRRLRSPRDRPPPPGRGR